MAKFRIQPHVRLQEWVADENGFFEDEGLDYEFDSARFAAGSAGAAPAVQSTDEASAAIGSHEAPAEVHRGPVDDAPAAIHSGALEDMEQGRACAVSGACHWAVNAAATASHGRMWGNAYSVCNSGIFVASDSPYQTPDQLAGVPVGVGYHSGSHYSAIQGLEPFLQRSEIELSFVGRPFDRVRLMRERKIDAANVFGAQYYLLEQAGFRKLVDTTFIMGFLVSEDVDREDLERYFRAMRRAQREIDLEPERYKHLWLREIPEDLFDIADVRRFGPGERIVFEPYTRDMFERTHRWMAQWELLDPGAGARDYEHAIMG